MSRLKREFFIVDAVCLAFLIFVLSFSFGAAGLLVALAMLCAYWNGYITGSVD